MDFEVAWKWPEPYREKENLPNHNTALVPRCLDLHVLVRSGWLLEKELYKISILPSVTVTWREQNILPHPIHKFTTESHQQVADNFQKVYFVENEGTS